MKVLVSNDDGYRSTGVDVLARHALGLGEVQIVAPEKQQTASSKGLTFNNPLRVHKESSLSGLPVLAHNGLPADALPIYEHLYDILPDLVLSGINGGENTSIHSILTSGTCAVAMEAGLKNVPAFAFSMDVPEEYFFSKTMPFDMDKLGGIGIRIVRAFLNASEEFWKRVIFVNVNFPQALDQSTRVEVADLDTHKYNNYLSERVDPKGDTYYWLWGRLREDFDRTRDSYKVLFGNAITVTPVVLKSTSSLLKEAEQVVGTL